MQNLFDTLKKNQRLLLTALIIAIPAIVVAQALLRINAEVSVETASARWETSGHADYAAEAFTHWNEERPPEIPADCASCHSLHGYLDFLGARGTAAGSVAEAVPVGTVISCQACHNEAANEIESVAFSSGATVPPLNEASATCMHCHQSRESTDSVSAAINGIEDDTVSDELSFISPHYLVAASTKLGSEVQGAYEYPGRDYAGLYEHHEEFEACQTCHDPHNLELTPLECSACHVNVSEFDDLSRIRNTEIDFDGDGDTGTGIAEEIDNLHGQLHAAILRYADEVIGEPLVYNPDEFPYFFNDVDENGEVGPGRAGPAPFSFENRYSSWTPRLLRTAYNYHYVQNDPGAYAHNPHYTVQLLHDSLADLNERIAVEMAGRQRPDEDGGDD